MSSPRARAPRTVPKMIARLWSWLDLDEATAGVLVSAVDPSTEEVARSEGIVLETAAVVSVEDVCTRLELDVGDVVEDSDVVEMKDDDTELVYCEKLEDAGV